VQEIETFYQLQFLGYFSSYLIKIMLKISQNCSIFKNYLKAEIKKYT